MGGIHCAVMLGSRGSAAELSHYQFPQGFTEVHHLIKSSCDLKTQQDFHPREATCLGSPLLARARFATPLAVTFSLFLYYMCGSFHNEILEVLSLSIYYELL